MSWNYRRVLRQYENGESEIAIHEAYYDSEGRVWAITTEPAQVCAILGESESEDPLRDVLIMMLKALDKPVLDFDGIPEPGAINPGSAIEEGLY